MFRIDYRSRPKDPLEAYTAEVLCMFSERVFAIIQIYSSC